MNLGIHFHDLAPMPFEERVAHTKAFESFPGITALTPGFAICLKKVFAKNDVDFAVLGYYLNLLHPEAEELKRIQAIYIGKQP